MATVDAIAGTWDLRTARYVHLGQPAALYAPQWAEMNNPWDELCPCESFAARPWAVLCATHVSCLQFMPGFVTCAGYIAIDSHAWNHLEWNPQIPS